MRYITWFTNNPEIKPTVLDAPYASTAAEKFVEKNLASIDHKPLVLVTTKEIFTKIETIWEVETELCLKYTATFVTDNTKRDEA